ncbi:TPA: hypothetical protein I9Y78_001970 [Elizabethkingia anophelis]|uniref:hypothetical protein n=1 Tax=Elizabethkingia anophelis TaxID=1117645 RepID=UPI001A2289BA|nr:hypothetical protein [Elizabethkingia anophelis]MDC8028018.1 hypothetical protein [Elizabethkingia anophelis]MDV3493021.1 hypothetical protein [Elizabethkingia anophelis]HAT3992543.1 hypothetical protein [Elizabethkingia anophelis]HAT3996115.1 hypothetical protein [Elizabethkingia anophelis]HAT4004100.1 hypothetical protein [Elizabethkingia anophelis]
MNIILILSVIIFHLPLAFYRDTIRRYKRMEHYNINRAFSYEDENGDLMEVSFSTVIFFISSFLFSLLPLILGMSINWIVALIINIFTAILIVPFLAFYIYPMNRIFTKRSLNIIGMLCISVGFILLLIGTIK